MLSSPGNAQSACGDREWKHYNQHLVLHFCSLHLLFVSTDLKSTTAGTMLPFGYLGEALEKNKGISLLLFHEIWEQGVFCYLFGRKCYFRHPRA